MAHRGANQHVERSSSSDHGLQGDAPIPQKLFHGGCKEASLAPMAVCIEEDLTSSTRFRSVARSQDVRCLQRARSDRQTWSPASPAAWQHDYNEVRPHSAHGGWTADSIWLPLSSPTSSPLRAGCAGGLRPGLTQAARDGADEDGRDGETPLDRIEKPRHDGPGGNPGAANDRAR